MQPDLLSQFSETFVDEFDSGKVIGIDSITEYYDVRLKYERLQELSAYGDRFVFIKDNIAKKEIVESIFTDHHPQVVVNLAACRCAL